MCRMRTKLGVVVGLLAVAEIARADAPKPLAQWEVRVAPVGSSDRRAIYALPVQAYGAPPVPIPVGAGAWKCQAAAWPTAGKESGYVGCVAPGGYASRLVTFCTASSGPQTATMTVLGPGDSPGHMLTLVCAPTDAP